MSSTVSQSCFEAHLLNGEVVECRHAAEDDLPEGCESRHRGNQEADVTEEHSAEGEADEGRREDEEDPGSGGLLEATAVGEIKVAQSLAVAEHLNRIHR